MAASCYTTRNFARVLATHFISGNSTKAPCQLWRTIMTSAHRKTIEENGSGTQKQQSTQRDNDQTTQDTDEAEHEHLIKQKILSASLTHVHEFGWTKKALEAGAKDEGLPPVAQGMFPRGGAELINYFYVKSNAELTEYLKKEVERANAEGLEKPKTKPLIRDAIEYRLRLIVPYVDKWPQAMAIQILPQNAVESWKNLLNLSDEIWYYAGDRSIDYNWYTKRLSLAGVYKSTEIFMVQDKSVNLQDTWAFLDRRVSDLQTFGACKKKCEQSTDIVKEAATGFYILGRNILGMNSRNR